MAIVRVVKDKNFITMGKYHLKEKDMSLKAIGLLSIMLSLPENWDYSVNGLSSIRKESKNTINEILKELETFGYLNRTRIRDEKGKIIEVEYTIFESPYPKNQDMENQDMDFRPQLNNNKYNNNIIEEINNKKEIYKESDFKEEFEELWKLYPKKVGKKKALDYYIKARKDKVPFDKIKQGIENYNEYIKETKTKMQYVKDGSTWFNQHCWEDERKIEKVKTHEQEIEEMKERLKYLDEGD